MKRLLLVVLFAALAVLGFGRPASAHPLGNFSVNELAALDLYPARVDVAVTVDLASQPIGHAQGHATVTKPVLRHLIGFAPLVNGNESVILAP